MLPTVLERVAISLGADREGWHRALAGSMCVSADMAHATHPNYPERHDPGHWIALNGGPVVKTNVNGRYASDARSAAVFLDACDRAGVPVQHYSHRNDLPCGSTIGPITAARLGIPTVDVGAPQLAMHSARELMGSQDPSYLADALAAFLQ
jgi:aspartyl aminopeptidase